MPMQDSVILWTELHSQLAKQHPIALTERQNMWQADGASISGVVCSQATLLYEAPALAFQSTAAQQSRAAMQPDAAPELGPETAAATTAVQASSEAALQPSSSFSPPPADPGASGSESNDRLSQQQDTLADVHMDSAEESGSGKGQTVTALVPKAARLLTALCINQVSSPILLLVTDPCFTLLHVIRPLFQLRMCVIITVSSRSHRHIDWPQGFLHLLLIGAGFEAEFTLLMVPVPPLPIGNRIGGER
jgi:hypothetical protein